MHILDCFARLFVVRQDVAGLKCMCSLAFRTICVPVLRTSCGCLLIPCPSKESSLHWPANVTRRKIAYQTKLGTHLGCSIEGKSVASDYEAISQENQRRYGTDIGRIGPMLLADRYDDRTHFIFELLQNAEDALRRRTGWEGARRISFRLTESRLELSHFGKPFDEGDVKGVCGIAESTKDEFSIGRFGIGFKSVYTFTDRPEIHSGDEDFFVEDYVQPQLAERVERAADETVIALPLRREDQLARQDITRGFRQLGPGALLFLRHINEISWDVASDASGVYRRSAPEVLGPNVQRITLVGQETGKSEVDENWLVFHRDVFSAAQKNVGRVEIAFSLSAGKGASNRWSVQPVAASPLVVFFPTVVPTNLGFLVQGPYQTTPSRDNIPKTNPWNQHLVQETSDLLVEAMRWMRDNAMFDTSALRCLPMSKEKFPPGEIFSPVFETVRRALLNEPLLPRFDGGFVAASQAKLGRTQEIRELFSPQQIEAMFGSKTSAWLTGDITPDRQPEIRTYLMQELGVAELTPATLVPRLSKTFLEAQADDWVLRLYEFLSRQESATRRSLDKISLIRLEDGTHVLTRESGSARAFLPSAIKSGFPTIRAAVCATSEARSLLIGLGITEPDPVDDVIWNVLPKYQRETVDAEDDGYADDIGRIRAAFKTDSKTQREKLLRALRETSFVMVVDTTDGGGYVGKPEDTYFATERLRNLYAGVPGVLFVDTEYTCLLGDEMRELLEACGALRHPRPEKAPHEPYWSARLSELRQKAGHPETSGQNDDVQDWVLQGFQSLLDLLPKLSQQQRIERASLIWDSLNDLAERRGNVFEGSYRWTHNGRYACSFPAAFVRQLNAASWVPDASGELVPPNLVLFETLGWKNNPFLLSKITFKPPIVDQLARQVGIDPETIDLLRKLGITSVEDLTSRLKIPEIPSIDNTSTDIADYPQTTGKSVYDEADDLYGDGMPDIPPGTPDPDGGDGSSGRAGNGSMGGGSQGPYGSTRHGNGGTSGIAGSGIGIGQNRSGAGNSSHQPGARLTNSTGARPFVSYVGAHSNDGDVDPDGLDHALRMQVEGQAIDLIIGLEPKLRRTPEGNPGFDLYEANDMGQPIRWVEVKSMTGSLIDRPVGISSRQLEFAREKGDAFWLYVVEHARDHEQAKVLRIQNPFGMARTFTFDHGWSAIARTTPPH
jgi:hypothetical protein